MLRFIVIIAIIFSVSVQNSFAASSGKWQQNTKSLPQYCKDKAEDRSGRFTKWRARLGEVYIHAHHYCAGIYSEHLARYMVPGPERSKNLAELANQMRYVSVNGCPTNCALYPELHSRWGWALGQQGKVSEAIRHYRLAIRKKPNYTQAYAGLSDLYVELKQPDEARRVLKAGLKARPGSSKLKRRLQKLEKSRK